MLKKFRADLHIHTCLSPCADLTMSPRRVIDKAAALGLDIIAICDHNSAENAAAAVRAALKHNIKVLPGMEITTLEEAHILALFDETGPVLKLQEKIYAHLPPEENDREAFGYRIIANEFDEVEGYSKKLLLSATELTLEELVDEIHRLGGLAIASHIDREAFSVIGNLGFIPAELELDALEISVQISRDEALDRYPGIEKYPLVTSSDAHYLEDIGRAHTSFLLETPDISEIRKAFTNREGRRLIREE